MTPIVSKGRRFVEHYPNTALIFVILLLTFNTAAGAYAIYRLQSEQSQINNQTVAFQQSQLNVNHLICVSVNQGKIGRIQDYRFTLAQSLKFIRDPANHVVNRRRQIRITRKFYKSLIKNTKGQLIKCPSP